MRSLTPRETVIVAIALVLAVGLPLYRFVFAPQLEALSLLNRRIETQRRSLVGIEAAADRLHTVEHEHAAAAARVHELEGQIPANISVSGVMGRLSVAIAASGIRLIEVTFPAGTQPSASATEPIQELPFTVRLRGTFARAVAFLQLMESSPRVAAEQSIGISGGGPSGGVDQEGLEITLSMKAFALR